MEKILEEIQGGKDRIVAKFELLEEMANKAKIKRIREVLLNNRDNVNCAQGICMSIFDIIGDMNLTSKDIKNIEKAIMGEKNV